MNNFEQSYLDYRYLKERGYPEKASLKLVGDRYRLTRLGRNCLFRGVTDEATAAARTRKIVRAEDVNGEPLGIDWYNVLITLESYLKGAFLFLADDGILRDSSSVHGSFRESALTEKALSEILRFVRTLKPGRVDVFLDSPIAFSARMVETLRVKLSEIVGLPAEASLAHSADYPLKSYVGIVASSDSVVLDAARRVFDLPRRILEERYGFTPPRLPDIGRSHGAPWRLCESENPSR